MMPPDPPCWAETVMVVGAPPFMKTPVPVADCAIALLALPRHITARKRVKIKNLLFIGDFSFVVPAC
jgi:hypothetical protein